MSLYPATIRPAVSPETIGKVTRLFNGHINDIIAEMFQNARRAGASRIEVTLDESRVPAMAIIRDDGQGIYCPDNFVTLGQSGWNSDVREAEDPAGMGVFSLAGARVTVTSKTAGAAIAWTATISPEAWTGGEDVAVSATQHPVGTTIAFELTEAWRKELAYTVERQARYLPIPVSFQGKDCTRYDWLGGTFYRASWKGCTIGVVENHQSGNPTINFHGLTVQADLAVVKEVHGRTFTAIVDMGPSNDIQLVLPARKEVVRNDAYAALREAAERVIYEAIGTLPDHKLAVEQWRRAAELGVALPEAKPVLHSWRPKKADGTCYDGWNSNLLGVDVAVLMPELEPITANPFHHALRGHPLRKQLAERENHYAGYAWYDALPWIEDVAFTVSSEAGDFTIVEGEAEPKLDTHLKADTITLGFVQHGKGKLASYQLPTDVALVCSHSVYWGALDDAAIVWRECEELSVGDVVDLLEAAFFCAGEDCEDDSYETQQEYFSRQATTIAVNVMCGADAALCDQVRRALRDLACSVPDGKRIEASMTGKGPEVRLVEIEAEAA